MSRVSETRLKEVLLVHQRPDLWDSQEAPTCFDCIEEAAIAEELISARAELNDMRKPVTDELCILAEQSEGETRALLEVISCRLGYGHIADLLASRAQSSAPRIGQ